MVIGNRANGFEFGNQTLLNQQIRKEFAKFRAVFIENFERVLLFHLQSDFAEPMGEGILVDLFEMAVPMITVDRETGLPHNIAKRVDRIPFHGWPSEDVCHKEARKDTKQTH